MGRYDSRRLMLDPGLTALALRALKDRGSRYPFVDRHVRRRGGKQIAPLAAVVVGTRRARGPYLLIVHRDHSKLSKALQRALGSVPQFLQVISDHRTSDRRRDSAMTPRAERRRGERRQRPPASWRVFGFLLAPQRATEGIRKRRVTTRAR